MTKEVCLVGCGPGGLDWVTPAARAAVAEAEVVFGPPDLHELFPGISAARLDLPFRPEAAATLVSASRARGLSCAVLVRGDCGIHSLARGIQRLLGAESCRRVPGISSVQVACARFGLDWDGLRVVSAHGCQPRVLESADLRAPVVAVLGGGPGFGRTVEGLRALLGVRRACLGSDLTLPGETLREVGPREAIPADLPSRTVALLPREES